jgi:hypothetical protein
MDMNEYDKVCVSSVGISLVEIPDPYREEMLILTDP